MVNYNSYIKAVIAITAVGIMAFSIVISQRPLEGIQLILFILLVYIIWRFLLVFEKAIELAENRVQER